MALWFRVEDHNISIDKGNWLKEAEYPVLSIAVPRSSTEIIVLRISGRNFGPGVSSWSTHQRPYFHPESFLELETEGEGALWSDRRHSFLQYVDYAMKQDGANDENDDRKERPSS